MTEPIRLTEQAVLNINWRVRLTLTEHGRAIVSRANQEFLQLMQRYGEDTQGLEPRHKVSMDGSLTIDLWEAFHLFGGEGMPGYPTSVGLPFATDIVILPDKD